MNGPAASDVVTIGHDGSSGVGVSREQAHLPPGVLHLAVSVQVVDLHGRWLVQCRAGAKVAFANRWANTCCTHPGVGEDPQQAVARRLRQELGLVIGCLRPAGAFVYRAVDPVSGLVEHELDHVFVAVSNTDDVAADPLEVSQFARLGYAEALRLVTSVRGAPWAGEVLRRAFDVLGTR